jgi:transcription elongation factor Elf1
MADDDSPAPRVKTVFRYAVVCPSCGHSAVVKVPRAKRFARMRCSACKTLLPFGTRKEVWKAAPARENA